MNQPERRPPFQSWRGLFVIGAIIAAVMGIVLLIKRLRHGWSSNQRGLTLLEVLIAAGLIGLIGVGIARALDTNARAGRVIDEQVQATNLITSYMENMRQLSYDDSANAYASIGNNVTMPAQFAVSVNLAYSGDGTNWASTNNSGAYKLQKISISVVRTNGKVVLTTCTFRTMR